MKNIPQKVVHYYYYYYLKLYLNNFHTLYNKFIFVDIWSIGMIYYEILVGKIPWTARSQYELVTNIEKISV